MLRIAIAALLAVGVVGLVAVPEPTSFLIALLVMVAVFLLGAARLAIDLIELSPRALLADVAVLVAIGIALSQIPLGNVVRTVVLFVVGITTQIAPRSLRR
jgi:hypothetical protein